jgi:hypothetical protein
LIFDEFTKIQNYENIENSDFVPHQN